MQAGNPVPSSFIIDGSFFEQMNGEPHTYLNHHICTLSMISVRRYENGMKKVVS